MRNDRKFLLIILGSALEYYDFVLYGLLATHISKAFFPASNSQLQLIQSLSIFALGYLVRPLAGTILGIIADRYSKVKVFTFSILLMGLSTLFIGLLPSYEEIGIAASILLVLARIAQGISFASEIPGAVTILSEYYLKKDFPDSIGHLMSSTNFGFILASFLIYMLHLFFTNEQISSWAWRLPFIIGGLLAFLSYYIRRNFYLFSQLKTDPHNRRPLSGFFSEIAASGFRSILQGMGITSLIASGTMFFIYLPHFLEEYYSLDTENIRLFFLVGLVFFMFFCFIFGKILTRLNKIIFFVGSSLTFPLVIYFLILQINLIEEKFSLFFLFSVYEIYMAALFVSGLSLLPHLFPLNLRNTCVSWCYNFCFSFFSLMPVIVTHLMAVTKKTELISVLFLFLSIISISSFSLKKMIYK